MYKRGEDSPHHRVSEAPAASSEPDPNGNGSGNKLKESGFEGTGGKRCLSWWEGNLGSKTRAYNINDIYNSFSLESVEMWHTIPCRDLLALADANGGGGGGYGGGDMYKQVENQEMFGFGTSRSDAEQYGQPNASRYLYDLNSPPMMVPEPEGNTGRSSRFMPATPEARRTVHGQVVSDIVILNGGGTEQAADKLEKERCNLDEQSLAGISMLVEADQDFEKGLTQETNLNETPQPKQRKRKHRPKVVIEGQPKSTKKSTTPPKPDGSSTGKRKYVRRKGVNKATTMPETEEANETVDLNTVQPTKSKKSCKRKIDFDKEQNLGTPVEPTDVWLEQRTEIVVENTQVELMVDKSCATDQVVETDQTTLESQSPSPITPSKTELPHGRPTMNAKHTYTRAKCAINFLQETHDKGQSTIPSPNDSNCSTSACFNEEGEAKESKQETSSNNEGMKLYNKIARVRSESLEAYLSKFTDYNSGSKPGLHIPSIYKKNKVEKRVSSMCLVEDNNCSFLAEPNTNKALEMSTVYGVDDDQQAYRCMQTFHHMKNFKNKRTKALTLVHDSALLDGKIEGKQQATLKGATGYQASHQWKTSIKALDADFQDSFTTTKQAKRTSIGTPLHQNHQWPPNHIGCHPRFRLKRIYDVDALVNQFDQLDMNSQIVEQDRHALIPYSPRYNEKNALVVYQRDGSLVPFEGLFNPVKKRKPRPKVDLDDETSRVWRLLLEDINSQGIDGTDEEKAKWWEEERKVFSGRADSFIARMHLVQGDRRFSQWKGSVLDSVIGVFLTQNVSDHLSSSAFMSLAARFPLKSKSSSEPLNEEKLSISVTEPCQLDEDETITWHEEKSNQPTTEPNATMLQDADSYEEKVVNSNEFLKISPDSVGSKENSEFEVLEVSGNNMPMYKESAVDKVASSMGEQSLVDDIVSSQNSADTCPNSVQSSIGHTEDRLGSCAMRNSGEELKDESKATIPGGSTSFVQLLHMQGSTTVHGIYSQGQANESSNKNNEHDELESTVYPQGQNKGVLHSPDNTSELTISPKDHELQNTCSSGDLKVKPFEVRDEREIIHKKCEEKSASEQSELSAESASQATVQLVKTTSSQEATKSCHIFQAGVQEIFQSKMIAKNPKTNTKQCTNNNNCEVQEGLDTANFSAETSEVTESNIIVETSRETMQKVVESNSNDRGNHQMIIGTDEGSSKAKSGKVGKPKPIEVEWDSLRLQAEVEQKRERTPNTMDSLDYDAVRRADVSEVADAIKERGMNNKLAERMKDFLDRLVRDHGSTDLEWLRDVPPDKAKEYLLSFRGLGLKSVECVRLLTLHHLAFPVDTNVGRIAVRLGWVPLQPLPESLQLHLLELYPVLESIQKYLWPRLCKLDQRTLYELHYQMITFGKVFCTKSKPNCNACPMRGECRHFASAFASARLALPAPEDKSIVSATENRTNATAPTEITNLQHLSLPPANQQLQQCVVRNCDPVIEEPATPEPIVEVPATPEPEPEQIQQELDIEDFCEDPEEIPMIKLNFEEFTQNLQTYIEKNMELGEGDMSRALVALTSEAASIPTPKLKNVSQLRTEHQVYELPDSHPLLEGLDKREPDDPCSYLLAIWAPGETADSIQPPEGQCHSQETGTLCNEETCFFCNSTREANSQTVRGTLLIPCRTAMRGSFPLNGTYFQVNEVFADHDSSLNPIDVPRSWLWNLPRRTVYFGTSIPTIFKGLTTKDIQYCFWRGFVCVRGFDQKTRAPRPLMARLHFPASKLKRSRGKTTENQTFMQSV